MIAAKGSPMRFLDLVGDIAETSGRLNRRGPFLSPEQAWSMTRKTLFRRDLEQFLTSLDDRAAARTPIDDAAAMLMRMATIIHGRWLRALVVTDLRPDQIGPVASKVTDLPMEHYEYLTAEDALNFAAALPRLPADHPGLVACYIQDNTDAAGIVDAVLSEPRFATSAKLILFGGELPGGCSEGEVRESKLLFRGRAARFGADVLSCLYVSNTTTAAVYHD